MTDVPPRPSEGAAPRWQPLSATDRRVAGVLVEKAKTTPDGYPMTTNGLRSGCNQKNNRSPLMEVELEDIEESLERLRAMGAVTEVQSPSRVAKYRHHMYEWLGVDKFELAVMTELLLRGAQTEGELRGRAARMDPIPDLAALRPVLASLKAKGLIISLTPEGRGHVLTHALYEPRELEKLKAEHRTAGMPNDEPSRNSPDAPPPRPAISPPVVFARAEQTPPASVSMGATSGASREDVAELRSDFETLRSQVEQLRKDLDDLWSNFR